MSQCRKKMAHEREIMNFYSNTNILITGGSGFLGKLLIQKLLAAHNHIHTVYVIIRSKGDQSPSERFNEVLKNPVFELLRQKWPTFSEKICVLRGDIMQPGFGLNDTDRKTLIEMVDIVFHCAASVKFNAKLKDAVDANVKSTYRLLDLCHEMKRLKSLVFISTAYSNCNISQIEEKIYKSVVAPDTLVKLADHMEETAFDRIVPGLTYGYPNTYTFSKNMSEQVLLAEGRNLPVVLFRPSIVTSSYSDPIPGWSDNFFGPNGLLIAYKLGIGRVFLIREGCMGDIVPADYCVNALICSAWDAASKRLETTKDIPVYNYCAGSKYATPWCYMLEHMKKDTKINLNGIIWKPIYILTGSAHKYFILNFFLHRIPAYVIDYLLLITGREPRMKTGLKKFSKLMGALSYFTTNEWNFKNDNVYSMWDSMSAEEKILYPFHIGSIDYKKYFETYCAGLKVHVLKEPLEVDGANGRYRRFVVAHNVLMFVLVVAILWVVTILVENFL